MSNKLVWTPFKERKGSGLWMVADLNSIEPIEKADEILEGIANWCRESRCGCRMSYDMWKFSTDRELSMFLLRWA